MKNKLFLKVLLIGFFFGLTLFLGSCVANPPVEDGDNNEDIDGDDHWELNTELSIIELGDLRIQLLSDSIVRIENKGPKGFENRPSYIVLNRNDYKHVDYTIEEKDNSKQIITKNYIVHVPNGAKAEDTYITNLDGQDLWTYSDAGRTDTNVYLPSPSDELKSWYFTDSPRIIPSEHGYSYSEDVTNLQNWDFDNDALDVFVFLPGGDYSQFCSDYVKVTGESEMVSLQTLGFWDSRWYPYSSETAIQQILDYQEKGFSIDVLVIDTDWRASQSDGQGSGGIGYDINTDLFPNMKAFLDQCEQMGVDICFNDHPEPVKGTNNGLDQDEVQYREDKLTLILSLGLDYWWYDRNWSVALNSCDPDISTYAFGMYAYQWVTEEYRNSITDLNEFAERSLIMANVDGVLHGKWYYASDLSAHRYSIQWTGDIGANSDALAQEIYAAVFGGAEVGLPYMSSDIGGHNAPVTNEMYARWIQYGALSTICRVHCTLDKYINQEGRMPWLFGETAEEVAHTYLDMRYRLLPLYYSLSRDNYDNGLPIMQRLDIKYPQYVESSRNDQYMLGDYILVAPINETDTKIPASALSYTENGNVVKGLKAEYFNNNNWTGNPVITQTESNVYYDWTNKGPRGLGLVDNFSVKWTGDLTIGDKDAALSFFADDAVVVSIDGVIVIDGLNLYDTTLTTPVYKAGSKHTIEIQYAEYGGNAHIYTYYKEQGDSYCYNTRDVFIPDGTWIDVWSGERFVGPATYTVTHPLETSPLYVREGAIVALAPNMKNTSEKDWSEMALDIYPSVNYDAKFTLYEDDTKTDAYKAGYYRKTDITMDYDGGKDVLLLNIGAAKGTFHGKLAFENRKWNVRLHTNPGWGDVVSIVVNGEVVDFDMIAKSSEGKPFAYEGSALDSDVYTFTVEGSVYDEYEIKVFYENTELSLENTKYEKVEIPFDLSVEADVSGVNLSKSTYDWVAYGEDNNELYKTKNGLNVFSETSSYDSPWIQYAPFAKVFPDNSITTSGLASQKDFSFVINTNSNAKYYILYLGGYQSTAKVTVRDTAGNVKTVNFGNIDGYYTDRVVIKTDGKAQGKLYVTYSMVASEYTKGIYDNKYHDLVCYVSMYAVTACAELPTSSEVDYQDVVATKNSLAATGSVNLTDVGNLDWMHFTNANNPAQKADSNYIQSVRFGNASFQFGDYTTMISYIDEANGANVTNSQTGTCSTTEIKLEIKVTSDVKQVLLYTGAWSTTSQIEVYSSFGKLLATHTIVGGNEAATEIVSLALSATYDSTITVVIKNTSEAGNVSLAAVAVSNK